MKLGVLELNFIEIISGSVRMFEGFASIDSQIVTLKNVSLQTFWCIVRDPSIRWEKSEIWSFAINDLNCFKTPKNF